MDNISWLEFYSHILFQPQIMFTQFQSLNLTLNDFKWISKIKCILNQTNAVNVLQSVKRMMEEFQKYLEQWHNCTAS